MMIDLRSDTVTKPSKPMLEAMFTAAVGDEIFDEDPTVDLLEHKTASIFGMEDGLFCPSGTMTNQIGIKASTEPLQEIICDKTSHIYNFEGGGIPFNSAVSVKLVSGERGRFTAQDVLDNINPDNIHYPITSLVCIENTSNRGGGAYYTIPQVKAISDVCKKSNLKLHLDGARIFNALVETKENPEDYGKLCNSISICLSKGLGAPVGSVLLGSKEFIKKGRRIRKALGGGMRQAGYIAAAGIYALDSNIERLKDDHKRAKAIEANLKTLSFINEIMPVETNIIIFKLTKKYTTESFLKKLLEHDIKAVGIGKQSIRMVTHLDFDDGMLEKVIKTLKIKF